MYLNIVFSGRKPLFWVKRKSKRFFGRTDYIHRNGVFVHPVIDSFFSLDKNTIHIHIPNSDKVSQDLTIRYLQSVFGDRVIGISGLDGANIETFNSINYVLI